MKTEVEQICTYINDKIMDEVTPLEMHVSEGHCADFSEYKFITGKIRGFVMARQIMEELYTRHLKDEEK